MISRLTLKMLVPSVVKSDLNFTREQRTPAFSVFPPNNLARES